MDSVSLACALSVAGLKWYRFHEPLQSQNYRIQRKTSAAFAKLRLEPGLVVEARRGVC